MNATIVNTARAQPVVHHPLVQRLADTIGAETVTAATLDAFCAAHEFTVLFFTGDPVRQGESLDIAVILPELHAIFASRTTRFAVGIANRGDESALQTQFGFRVFPTLVFLRRGSYLGAISGVLDWVPFVARVDEILSSEPTRPPSIGIAIANSAPACS